MTSFLRDQWGAHLDVHLGEIMSGTAVSFLLRASGRLLALGFNILLARLLGAEGAGIYYLAMTVTAVGTTAGQLGLPNALLRFTSAHAAREEWSRVAGVRREGIRVAVLASLGATAILFAAAPWIAATVFSKPELAGPLRLMSLAIIPTGLLTQHAYLLRGLQKVRDSLLAEVVVLPLMSLGFLGLIGAAWGVLGAVAARLAGATVALAASVHFWRRSTPYLKGLKEEFPRRELFASSLPLFWVSLASLVMIWADTLLLGIWETNEAVGHYGVAARLSGLTSFILMAVNTAAAPKFAALHGREERREMERLARQTTAVMTVLAFPLLVLFVGFGRGVLGGVFGQAFEAGTLALAILAVGQFINVATGSAGYLLMMTGHETAFRNIALTFAGVNLVLNSVLIPEFGIEGAAVATSVSVISINSSAAWLVYRRLSIVTVPFLRAGAYQ